MYMYNYSRNNATYVLQYYYYDWWPYPYSGIALHESGMVKFLSSSAALMTGVCWWCPYKMTSVKITSNDWRQSSCNFPGDWLHVWWHCSTRLWCLSCQFDWQFLCQTSCQRIAISTLIISRVLMEVLFSLSVCLSTLHVCILSSKWHGGFRAKRPFVSFFPSTKTELS